MEEMLASYLSPELSSSTRSPVLPTKPVRTTSALVGKAYSAAGYAAACLHTISLLQAYQAELLADLDEGEGIGPNACLRTASGHRFVSQGYGSTWWPLRDIYG